MKKKTNASLDKPEDQKCSEGKNIKHIPIFFSLVSNGKKSLIIFRNPIKLSVANKQDKVRYSIFNFTKGYIKKEIKRLPGCKRIKAESASSAIV
ncbi:hypothetical protein [Lacinutrix algicola]|uniref:hypothetical protein n=1 Tax=Lacinutrix algicola TaxID=342954 RepID=UPI000ABF26FE|nr:hypothetical protein [Lacinutrix algicola]